MAVIFEGRWTHSIQDKRMLELKKAEWYDTLKKFDAETIAEAIADVKEYPDENPSIQRFHAIALAKSRARKAIAEMEERKRKEAESRLLGHTPDSELARKAREEIRRLFRLKSVRPDQDTQEQRSVDSVGDKDA